MAGPPFCGMAHLPLALRRLGCPLGWLSGVSGATEADCRHDPLVHLQRNICGPSFFHLPSPRESCNSLALGQLALKFLSQDEHFGCLLGPVAGDPIGTYSGSEPPKLTFHSYTPKLSSPIFHMLFQSITESVLP